MMPVERLLFKIPTKSYDFNTMFHIRMEEKSVSQYEGVERGKKLNIKMKNVDSTEHPTGHMGGDPSQKLCRDALRG